MGIPRELASEIYDEDDLERVIEEINNPDHSSNMESNNTNINSSDSVPGLDLTPVNEVELPFQTQNIQDVYLDDISQPLPEGTRVFTSILPVLLLSLVNLALPLFLPVLQRVN